MGGSCHGNLRFALKQTAFESWDAELLPKGHHHPSHLNNTQDGIFLFFNLLQGDVPSDATFYDKIQHRVRACMSLGEGRGQRFAHLGILKAKVYTLCSLLLRRQSISALLPTHLPLAPSIKWRVASSLSSLTSNLKAKLGNGKGNDSRDIPS